MAKKVKCDYIKITKSAQVFKPKTTELASMKSNIKHIMKIMSKY